LARRLLGPSVGLAIAIISAGILSVSAHSLHLRISFTDSAARAGVYRLIAASAARGDLVAACLPAAIAQTGLARGYLREGDCSAGAEPVAKVIDALPGDVIDLRPERVAVNGVTFANSRTASRDSAGRLLPHAAWGTHRVAIGQVWLFGFNDARSWDARYFGPVPFAAVRGVLRPVVTW
jgi:conjugative transfer signal peptidase TraF